MPHSLDVDPGPPDGRRRDDRPDRAVRELEAALRGVLETVEDAVFVCDQAGRITAANRAAAALFAGRPVRSFDELLARLEPDASAADLREPIEVRLRDRPSHWLELRLAGVGEPRDRPGKAASEPARARVVVARDITAERRDRRISGAFLGMLSHELRTPITTVYAGSKVLARDDRLPEVVRRELAADVAAEAERLYWLVEDLLALARIERGELDLGREPVLLQRIVRDVLEAERQHWPDVAIVGSVPHDLPAAVGDQRYVEQVVRNLVANAARYSPPGGRVEVAVDVTANEVAVRIVGQATRVSAPADPGAPFELADQGPEASAHAAGAGIALFVSRSLIAAMGGRIWATGRRRPGGSEIGFALPCYRERDDRRLD